MRDHERVHEYEDDGGHGHDREDAHDCGGDHGYDRERAFCLVDCRVQT